MKENHLGVALRKIQRCLTKIVYSTSNVLQKAEKSYNNSLSPIASLTLGGVF